MMWMNRDKLNKWPFLAILLWGWCWGAWGYVSYTDPYTVSGSTPQVTWGYTILGPNDSSPGNVSCGTTYCWVGFLVRTGLGPAPDRPSLCDSGGICFVTDGNSSLFSMTKIRNGITWDAAYKAFIEKYGMTGNGYSGSASFSPDDPSFPYIAWGSLCAGFAALPDGVEAVSTLAPGAICGAISPPDVQCSFYIPETLDFGMVNVGEVPPPVSVDGSYTCSEVRSATASLGKKPSIGGSTLNLYLNNVLLSQSASNITPGATAGVLTLRGEIANSLADVGEFTESVPIILAFY